MRDIRVKTNQIELQVREYENAGDPIVFLHFGGANLMMWGKALPFFQEMYHLVLVDLRGHGRSDEPDNGYDMDTLADDVAGVIGQLGIKKVHVIGSSLGSEVGLALAANHPELVLSFVSEGSLYNEFGAYSTNEDPEEKYREFVDQFLEKIRSASPKAFPSQTALLESRKAAYGDEMWNEAFEAMEAYGIVKIGEGQYATAFRKKAKEEYFLHFFKNRLEGYFSRVQCSMIMIPDAEEAKDEKARAAMEALLAMSANGKVVEVENWSHPYGWLFDSSKICSAILKFLHSQGK